MYSTELGTTQTAGEGIAVDSNGDAYVTGLTNAFQTSSSPRGQAFVTKLNSSGTGAAYSTYLGGSGGDRGSGIAVDSAGDAFVTGVTGSANFPTTPGAYQRNNAGIDDAFVTKLNPTGSALIYSTYLGGTGDDGAAAIAIDPAGNA